MSKTKKFYKVFVVDNSVYTIEKLDEIFYLHRDEFKLEMYGSARTFNEVVEKKAHLASEADVFLISTVLPDRNGYELIYHIKKNINPEAKFIAVATQTTKQSLEKAMKAGSDAHLIKPFSGKEVIQKIFDVLGLNFYQAVEEIQRKQAKKEEAKEEHYPEQEEYSGQHREQDEQENDYEENVHVEDELKKEFDEVKRERRRDLRSDSVREQYEHYKNKTENFANSASSDNPPNERFKARMRTKSSIKKPVTQSRPTEEIRYEEGLHQKKPEARVYAFAAPKSYGKTTALVNVAAEISKNSDFKPKTVILDLDLFYPTVFYKLKEEELRIAKKNIYDLIEDIEIIDEKIILDTCHYHEKTGLYILNTPHDMMRDPRIITQRHLKRLIEKLKEHFDLILIDASGNVDDDTVKIPLMMSDSSLIFFNSEITSLFHTKKFVKMIRKLEERVGKNIIENSYFILNGLDEEKDYITFNQIKEAVYNFEEDVEINLPLYIPKDENLTYYSVIGQLAVLAEESKSKKDKSISAKEKYQELAALLYPMHKGKKEEEKKKEFKIFGFKISK